MATCKTDVRAIVQTLAKREDVAAVYEAAKAAGADKNPACAEYKALTSIFAAAGICKSAFKRACNMLPLYLGKSKGKGKGRSTAPPSKKRRKKTTDAVKSPRKSEATAGAGRATKTSTASGGGAGRSGGKKTGAFSKRLGGPHLRSISQFLDADSALALATTSKTTHTRLGKAFVDSVQAAARAGLKVAKELGAVDKSYSVGQEIVDRETHSFKGRLTKSMQAEGWTAYGKHPYRRITRLKVSRVTALTDPILYVSCYFMTLSVNLSTGAWKRDNFTISHDGEDRVFDRSKPSTSGKLTKPITTAAVRALYDDLSPHNKADLKFSVAREAMAKFVGYR